MSKYFQVPWVFKDVLLVLIIVVLTVAGIDLAILYSDLGGFLKTAIQNEITVLGLFLIQSLILLTPIIVLVTRKYGKWKWGDFGFGKFKFFRHLWTAILGWLMYVGISVLISILVVYGGIKIPGYQIQESILPLFGTTKSALTIAAIVIIAIAPMLEEVFFRGFVLQGLVNKWGRAIGVIATALIFAVFHLQFGSFIPIFILGVIMSLLFIRSKSIWPCIWFHVINNSIAFLVQLMLIKDKIPLDF
jgi:uncharacterized protein